jgi:hypothetical protein
MTSCAPNAPTGLGGVHQKADGALVLFDTDCQGCSQHVQTRWNYYFGLCSWTTVLARHRLRNLTPAIQGGDRVRAQDRGLAGPYVSADFVRCRTAYLREYARLDAALPSKVLPLPAEIAASALSLSLSHSSLWRNSAVIALGLAHEATAALRADMANIFRKLQRNRHALVQLSEK